VLFSPRDIFKIQSDSEFNQFAIKVFHYQYKQNPIYNAFVNHLFQRKKQDISSIQYYTQIPFLPIEFFKFHTVTCFSITPTTLFFESSGTTQNNLSRHYILDESIYKESILRGFTHFYGHPKNYLFIFLLPNDDQRPHSSLVYMAKYLQSLSIYQESGFYLNDFNTARSLIEKHLKINTRIFILGLSYALMDFCENSSKIESPSVIVMETGGMKGKRKEMPKHLFHAYLKEKLAVNSIHSEYGMTELLSQAYSKNDGIFYTPPWMKVLVREMDDPFSIYTSNKQGLINIIDLANIHSCSFIATSDLGKLYDDGSFEILGRSDFSDIRGCNLMYQ
jgi:hypothetical protein